MYLNAYTRVVIFVLSVNDYSLCFIFSLIIRILSYLISSYFSLFGVLLF